MFLQVLTPTDGRPEAFALLERWVAAQDWPRPFRWVVATGDPTGYAFRMNQLIIECPPLAGMHPLARNVLAGLKLLRDDAPVIVMEDDDYYGPDYLSGIARMLLDSHAEMCGFTPARYYHVGARRYKDMGNATHASLAQTAFHGPAALAKLREVAARGGPYLDRSMWAEFNGRKALVPTPAGHHVSVKGMPGTPGVGVGHRANMGLPDDDGTVFRAWGLPDVYHGYAADQYDVVYLAAGMGPAGGCRVILEHLNGLSSRGHAVALVLTQAASMNVPADWPKPRFPVRTLGEAVKSGLLLRAKRLVATYFMTAPLVIQHAAPDARRFYLIQGREDRFDDNDAAAAASYHLPLERIAVSRWLARGVAELAGVPPESIPVLDNGVAPTTFFRDPGHFPRTPGVPRILVEGADHPIKGTDTALAVVDALRKAGRELEVWHFASKRSERAWDRSFVRPDQATIRRLYSDSDVLLKTSRHEGRGLVHVEAMACGCPVVSTDHGGIDDLVGHALIAPVDDVAGLAALVADVLDRPHAHAGRVAAAGRYVREVLSWPRVLGHLEAILGLKAGPPHGAAVTITVPTYDRASLVPRALASIQAQTRPDWTCVVAVNGRADPDGYRTALAPVASDPRFTILDLPDADMHAAINAGLGLCRSPAFAILDDDDEWAPEYLERMLPPILDQSAMASVCRKVEWRDGHVVKECVTDPPCPWDHAQAMQWCCVSNSQLVFATWALRHLDGYDPESGAASDYDALMRASSLGPVASLPDPLVRYHHHDANWTTRRESVQRDLDRVDAWKQHGRYKPAQ